MKIYIDEELPKSCASCQFLVHCDQCEGHENYCPFIGEIGYDKSDDLKDGAPITPSRERHEECPLEHRPHGEWKETARRVQVDETDECCVFETHFFYSCSVCGAEYGNRKPEHPFCKWCGALMRKEGEEK